MSTAHMNVENSFYVTGGTLSRDAQCYVERQADQTLYQGLLEGRFCYVLTSRQMGKSSLMVRTAGRLREVGIGVAVLDLTAIGQNLTAEQWYDGLLGRIGQQLHLEDELEEFWLNHSRLGPLQRWMRAITEVVLPRYPARLVIFVDEIDAVRSLPFSTDEFFAGMREFYNRRTEEPVLERLTFCLLGVATPSDLIRDTRTTPFNVGHRIELNDFTEAEAEPLARGLGRNEKTSAKLLNRILRWTNGHPYLTQRLCQAAAEDATVKDAGGIDRLCEEMFFTTRARERDDNLLFVRERMLRSEADVAALLDLYKQIRNHNRVKDDETSPLVSVLRLSGVTRVDDGCLRVRNRIYERVFGQEWAKDNLPDAEVRRQREAYRRGLLRASAVAAAILMIIGALSFVAIRGRRQAIAQQKVAEQEKARAEQQRNRADQNGHDLENALIEADQQRQQAVNQQMVAEEQRSRAEEEEQAGRRFLYAAHMKLAERAWEEANIPRVQELLNIHWPKLGQEDLRGFEWYYLWQLCHSDLFTLKHENSIPSMTFSADSKKLTTIGSNRAIKVWDITTRLEMRALEGIGKHIVGSAAFSPDGKLIATGNTASPFNDDILDTTVRLWEVATGRELFTLRGHTRQVTSVAFSPDGKRLASSGGAGINSGTPDCTVKLWDVATGQELRTFNGHLRYVHSVAFSPDGKRLASTDGNIVKVWEIATGEELFTLKEHSGNANLVVFSPDGKMLASGSFGAVKLWDVATGKELVTLKGRSHWIRSMVFSRDGKKLAVGNDRIVELWDVILGSELFTIKGHTQPVTSLAFSPDGRRLASGGGQTVKLWDVTVEQELLPIGRYAPSVDSVAFSTDGKRLASGNANRTVKIWDITTRRELFTLKGHTGTVKSVAFSPDGKRLASGGGWLRHEIIDSTVKLWDVSTGQEVRTLKGHLDMVNSVTFSPDGKKLASGSGDGTVKLWDAGSGWELFTLKGQIGWIYSVAISPDGKKLASGGSSGIVMWDVTTGQQLLTLKGHNENVLSVVFSPDGKLLASGNTDGTVKIWDAITRREIFTLKGHLEKVYSVSFSPDGKRLASGSMDNTVKIWDITVGQELFMLKGWNNRSVAFSPDGEKLASGGGGYSEVQLWRAASKRDVLTRSKQ